MGRSWVLETGQQREKMLDRLTEWNPKIISGHIDQEHQYLLPMSDKIISSQTDQEHQDLLPLFEKTISGQTDQVH